MSQSTLAVVGAFGLVGKEVSNYLMTRGMTECQVTQVVRTKREGTLEPVHLNNSVEVFSDVTDWSRFTDIVFAAGVSDHSLGDWAPEENWSRTLLPLFSILETFRGNLIYISSQAVYSGLTGLIAESVHHRPVMPYGLAKLHGEDFLLSMLARAKIRTLEIHRLMYTYGLGERQTRLIPAGINSIKTGERVKIIGGGKSFINPLPVETVATFIGDSMLHKRHEESGTAKIFNLNHPAEFSVLDTVELLRNEFGSHFEVTNEDELWPVYFQGQTGLMRERMSELGMSVPDLSQSIINYGHLLVTGARGE